MNYKIRNANEEECNSLVDLLNIVTLDLHDKGIKQWEYPWNSDDIICDIKTSYMYVVEDNKDNIIGTFSIKPLKKGELFNINMSKSIYLYRIALIPEFQGRNIGTEIFKYINNISELLEKTLYLDCWAGNKKLKLFYKSCKLDYCGDFPEEDYMVSVLKLDFDNYN